MPCNFQPKNPSTITSGMPHTRSDDSLCDIRSVADMDVDQESNVRARAHNMYDDPLWRKMRQLWSAGWFKELQANTTGPSRKKPIWGGGKLSEKGKLGAVA
eukprot:jgi/Bigna1/141403/aug1.62_g16111